MALRYCFEQDFVARTLASSKPHDLAVIDTEGCESAVSRGVYTYRYLNAGALERERPYYGKFKHLRIAKYDGWVILASAGGAVTHTVSKDENGNIILVPVETETE